LAASSRPPSKVGCHTEDPTTSLEQVRAGNVKAFVERVASLVLGEISRGELLARRAS
jgi:hypothetical protein